MASSIIEMDPAEYLQYMKNNQQEFLEGDANNVMVQFAQWLLEQLARMVGMANPSTATYQQVLTQIGTNIGNNFESIKNFIINLPGETKGFFRTLLARVTKWLTTLGKSAGHAKSVMIQHIEGYNIGGTPLTKGMIVAFSVLSAVILIAGYKYFKGLASKSNTNLNTSAAGANVNISANGNVEASTAAEGTMITDTELQSYLLEGQTMGGEIMDILNEQTQLSEGLLDMFNWLGRMVRRAFNMIKEMIGYVKRFIGDHPVVAVIVLLCCFFVLFCTPMLSSLLGEMGKNVRMPPEANGAF